jgi:hypothetical protein
MLSDFKNLDFSRKIVAKPAIIKPRENQFSGRRIVPRDTGGRTDMTKLTSAFGTFAEKN